ncbi:MULTISPECIES: PRC-barrel domain-containing protein [Rhizobium]|jgi:sporulation protein YlmC with PRC-barrel domain|uniref:Photosystem reaction center subunit H n=1 Tax=Rhizobium anhuiense TaxID=1184720 RepID=A0ABX4JBQ1_9HYPH|nr:MULTISPECIES: PRC-barrel domain-containing protein [Rhizobium]KZS49471.1 photosystem reaction center subunit H [Rhizobium anhuiense bv. trifolii]MBB3297646.1 sporulation protein YlmC with PRC-barrel domain [Rhizobium sp. BK112]MBB3366957.1 sporulation protein YlmC with PRC-barrel domain [Rhizobium sp. BK077]MBB3745520.1 sporulation protein YlmC with PRC-barrel domain [Rhizobium sp. BK591]MBB4115700.1 sporulation protein YlmC with PRC-barrel domain [Rhizobium sp. BK226]
MTRKLLTTVAAGALFATAFAPAAFSQTAPQPADPAAPTQAAPADPAAPKPPITPDVTKPAGDAAQAPAPAATTDTAQAGYITEQAPDQISANTYIGQSVYNGNNESIGSVNDLIMKKDGGLVAAIVGVGGFLGIGEKNVAVPMDKITVAQNTQDGSVKLTTSETAESLKAAPEFKTLAMQSAEKAPATGTALPTDATSTGSTTAK